MDENTLIWYTSDNGSHKPADHIAGLRGCKGETWEGGIRVPAIIVWPRQIAKPMETEMYASTLDIMPTILDLLDITLENRALDGISLLPLLQGTDMAKRAKPMPFWRTNPYAREANKNPSKFTEAELTGWWRPFKCPEIKTARTEGFGGWAAWTEGRWKLHKQNNEKYELYDIEADPAETTDLAQKMPEVVKDLADKLTAWQCSAEASLAGADFETEQALNLP